MPAKVAFLIFLLPLLLWSADSPNHLWELNRKGYRLVLFLDKNTCQNLQKGDLFLFITSTGRILRKKVSKRFYNCKLYKKFREKPSKFKVIYVRTETLEVKDLGIIED